MSDTLESLRAEWERGLTEEAPLYKAERWLRAAYAVDFGGAPPPSAGVFKGRVP